MKPSIRITNLRQKKYQASRKIQISKKKFCYGDRGVPKDKECNKKHGNFYSNNKTCTETI